MLPRITEKAKKRVEKALDQYGLLLIQGQWEIPSIADLLNSKPITTKGYSWDYVPAWEYTDQLLTRKNLIMLKFFRGKNTIVEKRFWPSIHVLANKAQQIVAEGKIGTGEQKMLELVKSNPGISGDKIKEILGMDRIRFQKLKNNLEKWLCILGKEQRNVDYHTHDPAWHPWEDGIIAESSRKKQTLPAPSDAETFLINQLKFRRSKISIETCFPLLKVIHKFEKIKTGGKDA